MMKCEPCGKGLLDDIWEGTKTIAHKTYEGYKYLKDAKIAGKINSVLSNPIIDAVTDAIPYSGYVKKGVKYAADAGFGKERMLVKTKWYICQKIKNIKPLSLLHIKKD